MKRYYFKCLNILKFARSFLMSICTQAILKIIRRTFTSTLKVPFLLATIRNAFIVIITSCSARKMQQLVIHYFINTLSTELCFPYSKWLYKFLYRKLNKHGFNDIVFISICCISPARYILDIFKRFHTDIISDQSCLKAMVSRGLEPNFIHDTSDAPFTHLETYSWVLNAISNEVTVKNIPIISDLLRWYSSPPPLIGGEQQRIMAEQYRQLELQASPPCPSLSFVPKHFNSNLRVGIFRYNYMPHAEVDLLNGLLEAVPDNVDIFLLGFGDAPDQTIKGAPYIKLTDSNIITAVIEARNVALDIVIFSPPLWGSFCAPMPRIIEYRIAPTQIYYLGDIYTSGLKNLDYFVFPDDLLLAEYQTAFSETLWPVKWGYPPLPPLFAEAPVSNSKQNTNSNVTYITNCHVNKINDKLINAWATILKAVPRSRLLLYPYSAPYHKPLSPLLERIIRKKCKEHKLDPAAFVIRNEAGPQTIRAQLAHAHIYLDSYPYTGGFSTAEAVRAGLPSVCLVGKNYHSQLCRMVAAMLGLENDMLVYDMDSYISRAINLGCDSSLRNNISKNMRKQLSAASQELMNKQFSTSFWKKILSYKRICNSIKQYA